MPKFRKKPVVIEAITFDELVAYGRTITQGPETMPWSFEYEGQPITHETNECYLIPTLEGTMKFTPDDMLITGVQGEIYPCKKDIFEATYESVEPTNGLAAMPEPTIDTDPMFQFFNWKHLPQELAAVSAPFGHLAGEIVQRLPRNPERTVALRKLLESKDCAVRAVLMKQP